MKYIISTILSAVILVASAQAAFAYSAPDYPTCSNPEGILKVRYDEGDHGIVGEDHLFSGSDEVYTLSDTSLLQCFCADNGGGIQTNWWKVSDLSQNDIDSLIKQGWIFVADGAGWGLDNAPYLAKNNDYSCKDSENSDDSGEVLSSSTEAPGIGGAVLGLAATGDNKFVIAWLSLGVACISGGLILRRSK